MDSDLSGHNGLSSTPQLPKSPERLVAVEDWMTHHQMHLSRADWLQPAIKASEE